MSKYFTADNRPARSATCPGSEFVPEYRLNPTLNEVEKVGEINLQELISAHENSARLDKILEKYEINVDDFSVARANGIVDASKNPRSLSEAFELVTLARDVYDGLPAEIRTDYPSFQAFAKALDDGSYREKVRQKAPPAEENKEGAVEQ